MPTLTKIQHYSRLIALFGFLLAQSLAAHHAVDHTVNPQHGDCLISAAFDDDGLDAPIISVAEQPHRKNITSPQPFATLQERPAYSHTAIRAPPALLFIQL